MANLRLIKKDIDYLVSEVISDCWTFLYVNQGKNTQEAVDVINEAVELRNSLYERVNHPDKENMKAHYKAINKDLLTGVDSLFNKISNLVGGVK
jgi:hypothetical protein